MDKAARLRRLEELQAESAALLKSLQTEPDDPSDWPPKTFYLWYHVVTGLLLGSVGAISSLFVNVIGSAIVGKHPLEIIRIFMTFPMGEPALHSDSIVALLLGVMLYIITGAAYGIVFEVVMAKYFVKSTRRTRLFAAIAMGLGIWFVNFYLILSWLQPTLYGGTWIVDLMPAWVAMLTHLVFALVMLVIGEWGHFEATDYRRQAMVENVMNGAE